MIDDAELLDLLRLQVETPTGNPPGNERTLCDLLAPRLAAAGFALAIDEYRPGRANLEARLGDGPPALLLTGHLDTMPAGDGWSNDPLTPVERDGRLYGLGACDMAGGNAALLAAALAVARAGRPLRRALAIGLVADEEATGGGTRRLVERDATAACAVVAEPTSLELVRLSNGQVNIAVELTGRAAHASAPEHGANAVTAAADLVLSCERASRARAGEAYRLIGPPTYSPGVIAGGVKTSVVPDRCRVSIDHRLTPAQTTAEAIATFDALLAEVLERHPGVRAERELEIAVEPFETPADAAVCRAVTDAATAVGGRPPAVVGMRATTDAVTFAAAGIETVIFGPGSLAQAHAADEWVRLDEVRAAARIYAGVIDALCG